MSIFITLLLNLLISFIADLLKRYITHAVGTYSADAFINFHKDKFLAKVRPRFWLGFKRMDRASKAFDLAVANFKDLKLGTKLESGVENQIAQAAMAGIAEKLS